MSENAEAPPKISVSIGQKPADATEAQIDELLDTGRLAYDRMKERLRQEVAEVRRNGGH